MNSLKSCSFFLVMSVICLTPCLANMIPAHIIGEDERIQILDDSKGFYKYFGYIAGCSATLISPKHVLTAAHCFFDREKKQIDSNFQGFYPGIFDEGLNSLGQYNWKKVFFKSDYMSLEEDASSDNNAIAQLDYAVVELESEVPYVDLGLIELGSQSLIGFKDVAISMTGYPGEKRKGQMWQSSCFTDLSSSPLKYQCDTTSGQSGSSVAVTSSTKLHIIGVHSGSRFLREYREGVLSKSSSYTLGAHLGTNEIAQIHRWIKGDISKETYSFTNKTRSHNYELKSDCKDELLLYYTEDLKDEAMGPLKLSHSKNVVIESKSPFVFLRAESTDGYLSFGSSSEIIIEGGARGAFKLEQSNTIYGGTSIMTLNCTGDYVAKPDLE